MSVSLRRNVVSVCLLVASLLPAQARAQNWSFDARAVGLGGVGSTSNVAVDMVDEQRPYRAIVLPFGLLQVIPNLPKLDPTKDEFDLVRAIEYSASPIHFIVGRDDTETGSLFITDLRNGELNRDLNYYRGFSPATSVSAEGLASPNWGHTFKLSQNTNGSFQGIYAGAGPYFSMQTSAEIDPALAAVFASPTPVYTPNTSYYMSNDTLSQFALAVTGGYRARISRAGGGALDGLYIGANYHYLHGFQYEHFEPEARLDTNANGLLTVNPSQGFPVSILRRTSSAGERLCDRHGGRRGCRSVGSGLRCQRDSESHELDRCRADQTTFSTASSPAASSSIFPRLQLMTHAWSSRWTSVPTARTTPTRGRASWSMAMVTTARPSAPDTSSGSTGSSFAAAGGISRNGGNRPAASVSTCRKGSASMSRRSGRAPISNGHVTWPSPYRCGSCTAIHSRAEDDQEDLRTS